MKFISPRNATLATTHSTDDTLDPLDLSFHEQLRTYRVGLAILGTVLAGMPADPAPVFEELCRFAQRLRTAADLSEATEIRAAAQALEMATQDAPNTATDEGERRVWTALTTLANLLATATSSGATR
jgi:hypothetical protein